MAGKDLLRKLDLHALRCLCVLVEQSHVSRAADVMGISQPAMSAALAQLREVFQDPLLVRTAKGMAPTPNAKRIAASARAALELMEDSFALTRAFDPRPRKRPSTSTRRNPSASCWCRGSRECWNGWRRTSG
jgi:DNA-binding transcriptional LysR family regulator